MSRGTCGVFVPNCDQTETVTCPHSSEHAECCVLQIIDGVLQGVEHAGDAKTCAEHVRQLYGHDGIFLAGNVTVVWGSAWYMFREK